MGTLLDELTARVGLDRETSEKVVRLSQDNADRLPKLLGGGAFKGWWTKCRSASAG